MASYKINSFRMFLFSVVVPDTQRCYGNPIQINAASASGFIASYITAETGCGNHDAPWIIRVDPGQKINFTLYDFSTNAPSDEKTCQVLVTIKEATRAASRTVCAGDQRIRKEYTSRANVVEIRRMGINDDPNPERGQFLLKYEGREKHHLCLKCFIWKGFEWS